MNCPSRTDEPEGDGFNQNPSALSADLTTRNDLNGLANSRVLRRIPDLAIDEAVEPVPDESTERKKAASFGYMKDVASGTSSGRHVVEGSRMGTTVVGSSSTGGGGYQGRVSLYYKRARKAVITYGKFVGPGMMVSLITICHRQDVLTGYQISVAYIDPGNYSTDVAAGASYRFKLLFIVLMSNLFAIFLQSLCIKLGSVSGLNLAQACREFLPRWLNIALYLMAEAAVSKSPLWGALDLQCLDHCYRHR